MCFYEQHVYDCRDWKWGIFRQHCQAEWRTGETCGMKMVYSAIPVVGRCSACSKLEARQRRMGRHLNDYNRWRKEPRRYQGALEEVIASIKALEAEIHQLKSEKQERYARVGTSRRSGHSPPRVSSSLQDPPMASHFAGTASFSSPTNTHHEYISSLWSKQSILPCVAAESGEPEDSGLSDSTASSAQHFRPWNMTTIQLHHTLDDIERTISTIRIMETLFCADELAPVISSAFEDPNLGFRMFRTHANRMVQGLGGCLFSEAKTKAQRDAAVVLQNPASASEAVQSTIKHWLSHSNPGQKQKWISQDTDAKFHSKHSSTKSSDENDVDILSTPEYRSIQHFVFTSEAYQSFKMDILLFVHEPYETRVVSALGSDLVGQCGESLEPDAKLHIAREISWVLTQLLVFSCHDGLSYGDRIKAFVEDHMEESWNWWPLAPRLHRPSPGYFRLQWKFPCGVHRHVNFPITIRTAVKQAIKTASAFVNIDIPTETRSRSSPVNGKTNLSTSGSTSFCMQPGSGSSTSTTPALGFSSQYQQISMPAPVAGLGSHVAAQSACTQHVDQHLSLCVVASTRQFVSMRCDNIKTDLEFFAKMKAAYNKARGWPRLWLSMWQYQCSEFVLFHKYGYQRGARVDIGFPSDNDSMYDFLPRKPSPPPPSGPVSKEQFQDHYYLDHCPSLLDWKRYQLSYHGHFNKVKRVALDAVPKRIVRIDMEDGVDEYFYGLYAKEQRSFLRVAIYACLCNLPGVIFFFLWLFQWGHGSDLQNASVPLTLSLSLTLGFAAVVFGTREG